MICFFFFFAFFKVLVCLRLVLVHNSYEMTKSKSKYKWVKLTQPIFTCDLNRLARNELGLPIYQLWILIIKITLRGTLSQKSIIKKQVYRVDVKKNVSMIKLV